MFQEKQAQYFCLLRLPFPTCLFLGQDELIYQTFLHEEKVLKNRTKVRPPVICYYLFLATLFRLPLNWCIGCLHLDLLFLLLLLLFHFWSLASQYDNGFFFWESEAGRKKSEISSWLASPSPPPPTMTNPSPPPPFQLTTSISHIFWSQLKFGPVQCSL